MAKHSGGGGNGGGDGGGDGGGLGGGVQKKKHCPSKLVIVLALLDGNSKTTIRLTQKERKTPVLIKQQTMK